MNTTANAALRREPTETPVADDELASPRDVAEILNVSLSTLEYWRAQDRGPNFVKYGTAKNAAIRYPVAGLREWVHERARIHRARKHSGDTVMECIQQVIDRCAHRHQMPAPYRVTITDAHRQRAGVLVHEDRPEERIPGMAAKIERAYPPFVIKIQDAKGERKTFDVDLVQAPDGVQIPDARQRH